MQALSSVEGGYDLLAPKFDHTPFRTPDGVLDATMAGALRPLGPFGPGVDVCCGTGAGMRVLKSLSPWADKLPRDECRVEITFLHNELSWASKWNVEPGKGLAIRQPVAFCLPGRRQGGVLGPSALAAARRIVPAPPANARRHGATPSISVSSEKLRNVLITTISPST